MIKTEQDIKEDQLKALRRKLKEVLGFRFRTHDFDLQDIIGALKKEKIETDSFSILIATNTFCTAYVTEYKHYKKLNPLVWFLFFGMEDQPIFTINFFYKKFFPEVRILQPDKATKINIQYDQQYTEYADYGTTTNHTNNNRRLIKDHPSNKNRNSKKQIISLPFSRGLPLKDINIF